MSARTVRCGLVRGVVLTAGVAIALVAGAGPAAAHAALTSAVPADGQQVDVPPDEVRLEFTEPVVPAPDGLRVHDAAGTVVPLAPPAGDGPSAVVRARFARPLVEGSYIVTWRVVSADGHPVAGALVFSVGDPEEIDASVMRQVFASGGVRPAAVAAIVVRWVGYLGVLIAAGGVVFLVWSADERDRVALARPVRRAAALGACAAGLAIVAQAAQVSGAGLAVLARADLLGAELVSSVGLQSVLQVLALGVIVVALRGEGDRWLPVALAAAVVAVVALVVAGHTRTTQPAWLTVAADAVHASAAAVWIGGLVLLWPAVRRRCDGDVIGAAATVARFSSSATVAVIAVTAAGSVLGWLLVRTATALTSTAYGRVLIAKVLLAAAAIAVGVYNNRRLVPAVGAAVPAEAAPAWPDGQARAWARLRRTVRIEIVALGLVVAVTAALVGTRPAAEATGATGAYSTVVAVGNDTNLSVTVDPNTAGHNQIHLYLHDATGRPVEATDLTLRLSLPANDIGPIERTPTLVVPGHWVHAGRELAVPGRWRIESVVGVDRFAQHRVVVDVDVR
jgi:copper transport protein